MEYELWIRLGFFVALLLIMIGAEAIKPRRRRKYSRWLRWPANLGMITLNSLMLRLFFPFLAVDVAMILERESEGSFLPYPLMVFLGVAILDFVIYLQHVLFHAIPFFWRFHRMHHTDLDFDVTTGVRFHPVEIALSMGIKIGAVFLFAIPALAVLIFEVLLNATSMFTHVNWKISFGIDRVIRFFFVTPDMHRVHHSVNPIETNSNYGFNFSIWNRLLGTYRSQPKLGHEEMEIGLKEFQDPLYLKFLQLLIVPFKR